MKATYENKSYDLGDYWKCECGEPHLLSDGYLAAHWQESLVHTCPNCKRTHRVKAGEISLMKENKERAKHKQK
jgi:hypothetical protein